MLFYDTWWIWWRGDLNWKKILKISGSGSAANKMRSAADTMCGAADRLHVRCGG